MKAFLAGILGAMFFTIAVNSPRAYAQAVLNAPTVNVLAALVGMDLSVDTVTVTNATGPGFTCNSQVATCLKPGPGANTGIGTDSSGRLILGVGPASATIWFGDAGEASVTENGTFSTTGAYNCRNNCFHVNDFGTKPWTAADVHGYRFEPQAIGTLPACGTAVAEGTMRPILAASSVPTGFCWCTSDGAGSPTFKWARVDLTTGTWTLGDATTCNP